MGLSWRTRTRIAWALLGAVLLLAAVDGMRLVRAQRLNAQIAAGGIGGDAPRAAPELRFASAYAQAASGAAEAALSRYGSLHDDATALGQAARYNSANLLLRQAIVLRAGAQPGQALPLIELAKEHYRELLRRDPQDWDARYNLERAQRLLPDPEPADDLEPDAKRNAERAATTMRGYSPGLP